MAAVEAAAEKAKPTPLLRFSLTALTGATVSVRIKLLPDDGDAGEKLYFTAEPEPLAKRCARLEAENESMPGGYKVGEKLYFTGGSQTFESGDRLVHGEQGEVMGPGTGQWKGRLLIKFPNNNDNAACPLDELSRSPPPPPRPTRPARRRRWRACRRRRALARPQRRGPPRSRERR